MAIPDFQAFMLPVLRLLEDGNEHAGKELIACLADEFDLTDEERRRPLPSGADTYLRNRYGWARTYLNKAGLVHYPRRGVLQLTESGRELLSTSPLTVDNSTLSNYPAFVAWRSTPSKNTDPSNDPKSSESDTQQTPNEELEAAYGRLRKDLESEILDVVTRASPTFFEKLVVELLVGMGYGGSLADAGRAIGGSGDGGIDGIVKEDRLGLDAIYLQAKSWSNPVGRPEIQKFAGALQGHRARKGVFITTSTFTKEAREYVGRIESKIVLIDGGQLATLMVDHGIGVTRVCSYVVSRVDGDYFEED